MDVKIKFLEDCDPEDGRPVFKAGSVKKLNPASARHWVRRGKAAEVTAKQLKADKADKADDEAKEKAMEKSKKEAMAKAEKAAKDKKEKK